ncbi:MAG: YqgE/AlgH family protein [Planctomycetota bacterium]|nr:YqgE/AlgH family protein [Planctomycetota bacterium]
MQDDQDTPLGPFFEPVIRPGDFLVATPSLRDPHFFRSVILICDHDVGGSFGLMVNRPTEIPIDRVLEDFDAEGVKERCLQFGGPVDQEKIFALCQLGTDDECDPDAAQRKIGAGLFIPDDLQETLDKIRDGKDALQNYRFFLGYTGWGEGQLQQEISEQSWVISRGSGIRLLETPAEQMWAAALSEMGGEPLLWSMMPPEPDWN